MTDSPGEGLLHLQGVALTYRAKPALRAIHFAVQRGEQWALLGPNGAGKTSLARIISGQNTHYSGQVQRATALQERGIAYVCFEQAKALVERDRKLDVSEFNADALDAGTRVRDLLPHPLPEPAASRWIERLRINHILDRGVRFISTGEMRKALLASAILARPGLLILDSPLDGLDADSQEVLHRAIDELLRSGQPVLVLARQLADVPEGCSHVLVLSRGEIVAGGDRREVLELPAVRQLMAPPLPALGALPPAPARPYTLAANEPLLALRGVSVAYGETQVLRDVDWTFAPGQHCCISGPNGCGKTTLLGLLTGDNHMAYGQDISLFGIRRGSGESVWDIKQKFGQLDTQLQLTFARGMRVLEVVLSGYFDSVGLYDTPGDAQRNHALEWLQALGIGSSGAENFDNLSFGLQRVVLLARAMVKAPRILVLDEPTLGLDGYHRRLLLRAVEHIVRHSDTQLLFVSHSAGDIPACINQHLRFHATDDGFQVRVENSGLDRPDTPPAQQGRQ